MAALLLRSGAQRTEVRLRSGPRRALPSGRSASFTKKMSFWGRRWLGLRHCWFWLGLRHCWFWLGLRLRFIAGGLWVLAVRGWWGGFCGVLIWGFLSAAFADVVAPAAPAAPSVPAGPPTAAALEQAASQFQAAHRAFDGGDYESARVHYEAAFRLVPHPSTQYNLALTCERLLDYDAAIEAFERFLAVPPAAADTEAGRAEQARHVLAERSLRRLRNLPARISASAVPDVVSVTVHALSPSGERGAQLGSGLTPHIFTVPAGRYRLTFQRDGYFEQTLDIDAHVGQALLFSRQLRPRPRQLRIDSQPTGAQLFLDDRPLGPAPYTGLVELGSHRLRLQKTLFVSQLRPLELGPGATPLSFRIALTRSGRLDMIIGGAVAGASLGLLGLRIFQGEVENLENMPPSQLYKPLISAALPGVLGAAVAGLASWEMPENEAQLLIGSSAWGTLIGFGVGLGVQPEWLLPHVLAVGGGLFGGTIGTAVWRFQKPSGGKVALFNSAAMWSAHLGALGWAYMITLRPERAFLGQQSIGRTGEGGWAMLGSTLGGVVLGIGLANLPIPWLQSLTRERVAFIDLGGLAGGVGVGSITLGLSYAITESWERACRIAIPAAIIGLAGGLASAAFLTRRPDPATVSLTLPKTSSFRASPPQPYFTLDPQGGTAFGLRLEGQF